MKFELEVGNLEKSKLQFSRNWFTGAMKILVDCRVVAHRSPLSSATHFSVSLKRHYEFEVGRAEKHTVLLEKERKPVLAGVRAQTYRVFVDGQLVHEQSGR